MNLNLAGNCQDRRVYFVVALINRPDALFHVRFAETGHVQFSMEHAHGRRAALQSRQNLLEKERFQLTGWPVHDRVQVPLSPSHRPGAVPRGFSSTSAPSGTMA